MLKNCPKDPNAPSTNVTRVPENVRAYFTHLASSWSQVAASNTHLLRPDQVQEEVWRKWLLTGDNKNVKKKYKRLPKKKKQGKNLLLEQVRKSQELKGDPNAGFYFYKMSVKKMLNKSKKIKSSEEELEDKEIETFFANKTQHTPVVITSELDTAKQSHTSKQDCRFRQDMVCFGGEGRLGHKCSRKVCMGIGDNGVTKSKNVVENKEVEENIDGEEGIAIIKNVNKWRRANIIDAESQKDSDEDEVPLVINFNEDDFINEVNNNPDTALETQEDKLSPTCTSGSRDKDDTSWKRKKKTSRAGKEDDGQSTKKVKLWIADQNFANEQNNSVARLDSCAPYIKSRESPMVTTTRHLDDTTDEKDTAKQSPMIITNKHSDTTTGSVDAAKQSPMVTSYKHSDTTTGTVDAAKESNMFTSNVTIKEEVVESVISSLVSRIFVGFRGL